MQITRKEKLQIASQLMAALLSNPEYFNGTDADFSSIAIDAVRATEELIEKVKNTSAIID